MKVTMLTARPVLETARLTVRLADVDDVHAVIDYDRRNRDHLRAWEPVRDAAAAFDVDVRSASLEGRRADAQEGRGYLFLARVHGDDAVAASINLSNVVRGAFLFINGAWRDHVLTALKSPHPVEMKPA